MSGSLAALRYSLQGMLRITTPMAWSIRRANYMNVHVEMRTTADIFKILWDMGSNSYLSPVMPPPIVFVCLFGMIFVPTIWIRTNDTAQTIVCRYIGADGLFCWSCAMHSWRLRWRHQFKKLNNFSSNSVGIKTVIICGSQNIFLAQSSFTFG